MLVLTTAALRTQQTAAGVLSAFLGVPVRVRSQGMPKDLEGWNKLVDEIGKRRSFCRLLSGTPNRHAASQPGPDMFSLHTRYEGTEHVFPIAEAQNLMEEQLWPKWEERGYKIDRTCHPDNGWDKDLNFWTLNVRKGLSTMAEVAEELHWIAQHETIQLWS